MNNVYAYIFLMAVVTYAIRALPLTLIRKEIKSTFIRSFLYVWHLYLLLTKRVF